MGGMPARGGLQLASKLKDSKSAIAIAAVKSFFVFFMFLSLNQIWFST
jgi:hypothetical protein